MKRITILGSTGSVGRNVLKVISRYPQSFRIEGLTSRANIGLLEKQIDKFQPQWVAVADPEKGRILQGKTQNSSVKILLGEEGVREVASQKVDLVVSALVGAVGVYPTLEAIRRGNDIALANKEVLVIAGAEVMEEAAKNKVKILPLDSEHCAISQIVEKQKAEDVKEVILTCSGGPFYTLPQDRLLKIGAKEALAHPVWNMGPKITIDSATLMNKGFEVIAAKWLFNLDWEKIKVLIHPQAVVHSIVNLLDGVSLALISQADMCIPIQYVLNYPHREIGEFAPLDLVEYSPLTFQQVDLDKFPALKLAYEVGRQGGTLPAVMNASNEVAVEVFLQDQIKFPHIWEITERVVRMHQKITTPSWEDIWEADNWAREKTRTEIKRI